MADGTGSGFVFFGSILAVGGHLGRASRTSASVWNFSNPYGGGRDVLISRGSCAIRRQIRYRRSRLTSVLLAWLGVGYLEWLASLARTETEFARIVPGWLEALGTGPSRVIGVALPIAFLAVVTTAVWVKSWWKFVVVAGLLLGRGFLIWALVTTWNGLWVRNRYFPYDMLTGPLLEILTNWIGFL